MTWNAPARDMREEQISLRLTGRPCANHVIDADTSLAAVIATLDSAIISSQIDDWVQQSNDLASRLYTFDNSDALYGSAPHQQQQQQQQQQTVLSSSPDHALTVKSGSSMAPALLHHFDPATTPPSLSSYDTSTSTTTASHDHDHDHETDATPTETSISTGLASHFPSVPLLQENNGILQVPPATDPAHLPPPLYECTFWFLNCTAIFSRFSDWDTHCLSHFRGEEPPRSVQCPLCDWTTTSPDGTLAWKARMQHLARAHTMIGHTLRTSRPDFLLFNHLWRVRLIDDYDLKELQGGNHNLTQGLGNFVERGGGERRRRGADWRGGRCVQHVAVGRVAQVPRS
ncbi:hypothetical protein IAQ61_008722 [Plenodomus lingam]|nr:hypothetical protein IAQ61_008722 [Plenodomus lingam]